MKSLSEILTEYFFIVWITLLSGNFVLFKIISFVFPLRTKSGFIRKKNGQVISPKRLSQASFFLKTGISLKFVYLAYRKLTESFPFQAESLIEDCVRALCLTGRDW